MRPARLDGLLRMSALIWLRSWFGFWAAKSPRTESTNRLKSDFLITSAEALAWSHAFLETVTLRVPSASGPGAAGVPAGYEASAAGPTPSGT